MSGDPRDGPASADWDALAADLDEIGVARLPGLLAPEACAEIAALYADDARFRSRVVMQRVGFGQGEYKYFDDPLPAPVAALRQRLYPPLARIANRWRSLLGEPADFPAAHDDYRARCRAAGQTRPTPLLLRYGPGDYNRLHQDLYGAEVFPLQVTVLLSAPDRDFTGGAFVVTETRPRRQARAEVVDLRQGDAAVFPVHSRPVPGRRGHYRAVMRHGVSRLHTGERHALGVIFHDAE